MIVLEPPVDLPEGTIVRVEVEAAPDEPAEGDELSRMAELAGDTGVADLATNIDRYLDRTARLDELAGEPSGTGDRFVAETVRRRVERVEW